MYSQLFWFLYLPKKLDYFLGDQFLKIASAKAGTMHDNLKNILLLKLLNFKRVSNNKKVR